MDTKKIIKDSYPSSEKIYIPGKLFPIQVGMRKINLTDTVTVENGKRIHTPNAPVYVYDTSGPYTDPDITVDIDKGLPRLRESWITARGDVERQDDITSEYGRARRDDPSLDLYGSKILPFPTKPNRDMPSRKCIMPDRESSRPKWNMSPYGKTCKTNN